MKKITSFLTVLFFIIWFAPASQAYPGLLENSFDQCVQSLGKPEGREPSRISPATDAFSFEKNGWGITIHFWNQEAHCISYTKLGASSLSDTEREKIIDAYSSSATWIESNTGEPVHSDIWAGHSNGYLISGDKKVVVDISSVSTVVICTGTFAKAANICPNLTRIRNQTKKP